MAQGGFVDPASVMVDQLLDAGQTAFRDDWRAFLNGSGSRPGSALLRDASVAGLLPEGQPDLVKLALAAEAIAGRPSFRALATGRYRLLAAMLGTPEQRKRALAENAPIQALCLADRSMLLKPAGDKIVANGRVPAMALAGQAALLYLVVSEGDAQACYLLASDAPGVTIESRRGDGSGDIVLTHVELVPNDRLADATPGLAHWLAVIGVLDGLEALAAGQRLCREAVAAAKEQPVGAGTGFDDQDVQFRLAAVQARLVIASGYRAWLYRQLMNDTIDPFAGAVAKLWLSQCAEEAARVARLATLVPEDSGIDAATGMLVDAMRGNLLRDTIAAHI